jgi:hypothetical protein
MRRLCADVIGRLPEFTHIDADRVAISFAQVRKPVSHGLYAALTPMRFEGGRLWTTRSGRRYTVQRVYDRNGREMLYILSFYLPRFLDVGFHEKLVTVFHELWHISPSFDGDLRRHPGPCYVHSRSQQAYDDQMSRLVDRWLALSPPLECYAFLRQRFSQLQRRFGRIYGVRIPHPKLLPVDYC